MAIKDIINGGHGFSVHQIPTRGFLGVASAVSGPFFFDTEQVYYPHDFGREMFVPGDAFQEGYCPTDTTVQVG